MESGIEMISYVVCEWNMNYSIEILDEFIKLVSLISFTFFSTIYTYLSAYITDLFRVIAISGYLSDCDNTYVAQSH